MLDNENENTPAADAGSPSDNLPPRRRRRAASRPAGPPGGAAAEAPAETALTDGDGVRLVEQDVGD
ncbi:hypothetical protein ABT403_30175, partial [Streptomyces sp. NPDC000075]|uniref:hypothetical protein n=1 Tax=Streptomyces sp. NPDC000075 TaxID=3154241 RepID=UPI00332CCD87